jgi:putative transposase
MPYRKIEFVNGEIYHVVIKRIADRLLFDDISDYFRGIFSIYEFNNINPVKILDRRREIRVAKERIMRNSRDSRDPVSIILPDVREPLIEVLFFCLMPNHIHLVVKQLIDRGITKFMNKFGAGYAGYFKRRHEIKEKGYFFQNRFTVVRIKTNKQLKTVFVYVHTNPISLIEPKWKEKGIKNPQKVIKFLENYKWSSYQDYIGKKNFPSVTKRDLVLKIMGGEEGCKKFVDEWIKYKGKFKEYPEFSLE